MERNYIESWILWRGKNVKKLLRNGICREGRMQKKLHRNFEYVEKEGEFQRTIRCPRICGEGRMQHCIETESVERENIVETILKL